MKMMFFEPNFFIKNYWNGFKGYYYSPSKFLVIAALFVLIHFSLVKDFLGLNVSSTGPIQFAFLFFNIILFGLSSFAVFFKFKKI